ncbi:MAG TPA: PIN domain-containing protein, partial [Gemmata sp.]|nr:PIN domain-containing protein [Gemmata sp.]
MATTVASPVFVDTNILIYARLATSALHHVAVDTLDRLAAAGVELWTSRQILREYLASITRPTTVTPPLPVSVVIADVRGFESRFRVAEDGSLVTAELLRLISAVTVQGKQIHDANVVATMLAHNVPILLTHNTA